VIRTRLANVMAQKTPERLAQGDRSRHIYGIGKPQVANRAGG
jgi:hypothetical protein